MHELINPIHILDTVIFAGLGILVLTIAAFILDKLTPGKLWEEIIQNRNTALAIVAGSVMLGMAIIVAAAIAG